MVFKPSQKRPYGNIQIIEVSVFVILDGNLN